MTYEQNYLSHHGILGQKWGVRRYQNEDGTLTEEGKERYNARDEIRKSVAYSINKNAQRVECDRLDKLQRAKEMKKAPMTKGVKYLWGDKESALQMEGSKDKIREIVSQEIIGLQRSAANDSKYLFEQSELMRRVRDMPIDVFESDRSFRKRYEDLVFGETKGLGRAILGYMLQKDIQEYKNIPKKKETQYSKTGPDLSERANKAFKDNPNLTYMQMYKEMGANLNSDDPDDYKDAEDRWLKKHGY